MDALLRDEDYIDTSTTRVDAEMLELEPVLTEEQRTSMTSITMKNRTSLANSLRKHGIKVLGTLDRTLGLRDLYVVNNPVAMPTFNVWLSYVVHFDNKISTKTIRELQQGSLVVVSQLDSHRVIVKPGRTSLSSSTHESDPLVSRYLYEEHFPIPLYKGPLPSVISGAMFNDPPMGGSWFHSHLWNDPDNINGTAQSTHQTDRKLPNYQPSESQCADEMEDIVYPNYMKAIVRGAEDIRHVVGEETTIFLMVRTKFSIYVVYIPFDHIAE